MQVRDYVPKKKMMSKTILPVLFWTICKHCGKEFRFTRMFTEIRYLPSCDSYSVLYFCSGCGDYAISQFSEVKI